MRKPVQTELRVAELFAGVGGFRLGLEQASPSFRTVFSSQWEPPGTAGKQFASRCYSSAERFGPAGHSNEDIAQVLDAVAQRTRKLSAIDVVVGGFPCQDYSVAKPLNQAEGLVGKKGVLWWRIHRLLRILAARRRPAKWVILENVDRLLKSPASQRGRDFAIMLAGLSDLGYDVEWRVLNAADYGFPQRRRRVFIVASRRKRRDVDGTTRVFRDGILARAFPVELSDAGEHMSGPRIDLTGGLDRITREFGRGVERSEFRSAGFVNGRTVWTFSPEPVSPESPAALASVLQDHSEVEKAFYVDSKAIEKWRYLKGAKNERRVQKRTGYIYHYTEGALPFPDPLNRPARTILTSEGGSSPSRSKHIIATPDGRFRRLTPVELERLNGFPDDWTKTGMTQGQRAFCMGNALVIGVVARIAEVVARDAGLPVREGAPFVTSV